ncbi:MAG: segregation and condensation protein B [Parcubacteria group bacterium Gr01-1014_46]|nr:MAG: segregation and condensation protein B [Parcubacteria group bacterium Gr01-1014_46]
MELEKQIEAILFYTAEPVKVSFLAKTLEVKVDVVKEALEILNKSLENRGIKLLEHNEEVSLVTSPEFAELIEKLIKEERERDLGRAGIETLTIVAYKGPITKKEIEYIRGVNSQYAVRNLLLRGLIERSSGVDGKVVYAVTSDTIRFLGLQSITDLPEYEGMKSQLEVTEEAKIESEEE